MNTYTVLCAFFEEYALLFETLLSDEKTKLQVLVKGNIKDIENTIAIQQANAMRIENIEKKRERLLESIGMPLMTFKQIIDQFAEAEKQTLTALYERIEVALHAVKFYNEKGMQVANDNIHLFEDRHQSMDPYSKQSVTKK